VLTALSVPVRTRLVPDALPQVTCRIADNIEAQALDNAADAMDSDRVAFLADIGFTLALFISGLACTDARFKCETPLAILMASLLAAAVGIALLLRSKAAQVPGPT
jgi:Na+/H+ antiporter NhaA